MKFIKERLLTSKEIITIWLMVLVLYKVSFLLFRDDDPFGDDTTLMSLVILGNLSILLWLFVLTSFSFFARKHMKINVFTSFILACVFSSIVITWGSLYAFLSLWFLFSIGWDWESESIQFYFLFWTVSSTLFYLHCRIMTAPLEDDIQNKLAILRPIFSVQSYKKNIKVCCVGVIMWGCAIVMNAMLLVHRGASREITFTHSCLFGTAWFVYYCLICLYFRYVFFQRQAEHFFRIAFTFAASYFLASSLCPRASLSIVNLFHIAKEAISGGRAYHYQAAALPAFLVLAFYFNAAIQKAR